MYGTGVRTRRPRLLVVYLRYWSNGLDDHDPLGMCMEQLGIGSVCTD